MHTTTPPNVGPVGFRDGKWIFEEVPGMVQMPAGIPFVTFVGGDKSKPITVACLQTMDSLSQYAEAARIQRLVDELLEWTWGRPAQDNTPSRGPVFGIDGLKRNDRSAKPDDDESNDGSYNLASTILQGNGVGIGQPAVQSVTPDAVEAVSNITPIISSLYRYIIPTCVSKEELDATDFHAIDNNVFGFGGLDPNNTGLQLNVASLDMGGVLSRSIGKVQGSWHPDFGDDPSRWTMFTLLFRIPPGMYYFIHLFRLHQLTYPHLYK